MIGGMGLAILIPGIHAEAHLAVRRCLLLGTEFLPVELQVHALNNARVR